MQLALNLPNPLAARQSLFTRDGRTHVTSRELAKRFGMPHKNVLRIIRNEIENPVDAEFNGRNFAPVEYLDRKGERRLEYILTRSGFEYIVGALTGREAKAWRIAFIRAFDQVEAELAAALAREARGLRRMHPRWAPIIDNPDMDRESLIKLTGHKSPASITSARKRLRELGVLPAKQAGSVA